MTGARPPASRSLRRLAAALALAAAAPAAAVTLADGALSVSGFGRWGYGRSDGNAFILAREDGKADNVALALNVYARPMDRLAVSSQVFYDMARVNIDWAFAEWRFADALRLRAGQVKLPFGAYMEVKDVGTLRPFFNLPVTVYGYADVAAESYYGAGLTGILPAYHGFELSYDVYAGAMWVESSDRFRQAPPAPATPVNASPSAGPATFWTKLDQTVGGRLTVATPLRGLTLRGSGYRGEVASLQQVQSAGPAGAGMYAYGLSLEFLNDWLEVRSEAFRKGEGREATRQAARTGYVEVAFRFLGHLQAAFRAERGRYHVADVVVGPNGYQIPPSLRRHDELAAGLNYWLDRNMVLKLSYHWIDGNRFAVPETPWTQATTNGTAGPGDPADLVYPQRTQMVILGAQFAF